MLSCSAAVAQGADWEYFRIRICNRGTMAFQVASAEQKSSGTWVWSTDYTWDVEGWKEVAPKQCETVWEDRNWESRALSNGSLPNVDLIIAFTDSTGTWGAPRLDLRKDSGANMTPSSRKFCVRPGAFDYTMPQGEPSAHCDAGYSLMPAAMYFERPNAQINTATGDWFGSVESIELGENDRAVRFGGPLAADTSSSESSQNSSASSGPSVGQVIGAIAITALAAAAIANLNSPPKPNGEGTLNASLLGDPIVRWANNQKPSWYYTDGKRVNPVWGLDGQTWSPLMDAPVQQSDMKSTNAIVAEITDTFAGIGANASMVMMSDGRITYSYDRRDENSNITEVEVIANIAVLDLAHATLSNSGEMDEMSIPCKSGWQCEAYLTKNKNGAVVQGPTLANTFDIYFMGGDSNAKIVLDALGKLVAMYSESPEVVKR